jgi:hypothetical protein
MNITGCIACVCVALDCCQKAAGTSPQELFSPGALWVWWIAAVWWACAAYAQLQR